MNNPVGFGAAALKAMNTQAERESLITRYRNAYTTANGKEAPAVRYEAGFFLIYGELYTSKVRKSKLISMAQTLEARI